MAKPLIGEIAAFAGSSVPLNFLSCDGSAVSRTTYAKLFAAIGTTFGAGDGSTTFNLPNLKGRMLVGYKSTDTNFDAIGETGGANTINLAHTHEENAHTHAISGTANATSDSNPTDLGGTYTVTGGGHTHSFSGTSGTASATTTNSQLSATQDNKKPYITLNFIIRHKAAPPGGTFLFSLMN